MVPWRKISPVILYTAYHIPSNIYQFDKLGVFLGFYRFLGPRPNRWVFIWPMPIGTICETVMDLPDICRIHNFPATMEGPKALIKDPVWAMAQSEIIQIFPKIS